MLVPAAAAWMPIGQPLRRWALSPGTGRVSCVDSTTGGLLSGTSKGVVLRFPVSGAESMTMNATQLSDGQRLLHVHGEPTGTFAGGCFYDECQGQYVARSTMFGASPPHHWTQTCHATFIVGGGFMFVADKLCYFSLSIDGEYAATWVVDGTCVRRGWLGDVLQTPTPTFDHPTCVSVVDDGAVAVGMHGGGVAILDMETETVTARLTTPTWRRTPRAIDMVRAWGPDFDYQLAWTTTCGYLVKAVASRRTTLQFRPMSIVVKRKEKVGEAEAVAGDGAWTQVRVVGDDTVVAQSDGGRTLYQRDDEPAAGFVNKGWVVPVPRLENFAWHTDEKYHVSLLLVADVVAPGDDES